MRLLDIAGKYAGKYRNFFLFSLIGVINTSIHAAVVILVAGHYELSPIIANGSAFFAANIFSFLANAMFTFKKSITLVGYVKFLSASFATLVIILSISIVCEYFNIDYRWSLLLVLVLSPVVSYFLVKNIAFRN